METKVKNRIALSIVFFLSGLTFATLASRVPTIKEMFGLNEAELGSLLLVMPISSILGLPLSGWLVEKFETRLPLFIGAILLALFVASLSLANTVWLFGVGLFMFAFFNRICNIAMNTQAINVQEKFQKKINGSFHGLWSVGGIAGVGFSTLMVSLDIGLSVHFISVGLFSATMFATTYRWLMRGDRATSKSKLRLGRPDPLILTLGMLVFLAALTEGGMFDWSGVYFREVVMVEIFTYGYLTFMVAMAISRFMSDRLIDKFGLKKMYVISAMTSVMGFTISVAFPMFWPAMIGFTLVGLGSATIIPMTFSLAGTSNKYSVGMTISLIGTYGMVGMLLGPPLIGYIAHLLSLKASFVFLAIAALSIIPMSRVFFKLR